MRLTPVRTVAPVASVITVADVKEHLQVYHDDLNALFQRLADTAVQKIDGWSGELGRCLITQTWRQDCRAFPITDVLYLPYPDVQSVVVKYYDEDAVLQTFSSASYHLVNTVKGSAVVLDDSASWPTTDIRPDAVQITLVAGYGDGPEDVPEPIRSAALLMVQQVYEGTDKGEAAAIQALLAPYRRVGI